MARMPNSTTGVATPLKAWASRAAFIFFLVFAFALMIMGRSDVRIVEQARVAVVDGVAPILDLLTRPIDSLGDMIASAEELANLRRQNIALRSENERLTLWQSAARRLESENLALRELANLAPDPALHYVSARVVGDPGGAFVRSVLVNAGEVHGAAKGQAVVTGAGLVGRVAEVGSRSARVLLLTDMNSRVPVTVGARRDRAVLGGDNTAHPKLLYLDPQGEISVGDLVATSGHGGVFPPGLPVGVVSAVEEGSIQVQPFIDWDHMEFVRMIDYELPGLLRSMSQSRRGDGPDAAAGAR